MGCFSLVFCGYLCDFVIRKHILLKIANFYLKTIKTLILFKEKKGEAYVFKIPAKIIYKLIVDYGRYTHGKVSKNGKITKESIVGQSKLLEYSSSTLHSSKKTKKYIMAYTGGELNELNGKMGISNPSTSVPVMKLIKTHNPKSKDALVQLIEYHKTNKCECGIISTGTLREFGERLHESQKKYWGEYRYSLEECIQWEYDLFVVQSLKGGIIEKEAMKILQQSLSDYIVEEAQGYLDDELRVDLIVYDINKKIKGGVQVKPKTFKSMRAEVVFMQKKQNLKWGYPVWFLFYNRDETFDDLETLIKTIKNT